MERQFQQGALFKIGTFLVNLFSSLKNGKRVFGHLTFLLNNDFAEFNFVSKIHYAFISFGH